VIGASDSVLGGRDELEVEEAGDGRCLTSRPVLRHASLLLAAFQDGDRAAERPLQGQPGWLISSLDFKAISGILDGAGSC
jgi:hypothetical protein